MNHTSSERYGFGERYLHPLRQAAAEFLSGLVDKFPSETVEKPQLNKQYELLDYFLKLGRVKGYSMEESFDHEEEALNFHIYIQRDVRGKETDTMLVQRIDTSENGEIKILKTWALTKIRDNEAKLIFPTYAGESPVKPNSLEYQRALEEIDVMHQKLIPKPN